MLVPGLDGCMHITLTGTLSYQRSTAAEAGDRHFRDVHVIHPTMLGNFYASCAGGLAPVQVSRLRVAQAWAATNGHAVDRRASSHPDPGAAFTQYNSEQPIHAAGVTGRGKVCLVATAKVSAQRAAGSADAVALRPVTVCGH